MRISDWSSDVCSSDLLRVAKARAIGNQAITDVVEELVADDQFIQRAVIVDRQIALEVHGDRTVVQRSLDRVAIVLADHHGRHGIALAGRDRQDDRNLRDGRRLHRYRFAGPLVYYTNRL